MKEIKWGIIFSLAMLAWMVLERLAGLHSEHIKYHTIVSNFFAVIAVIIYIFALRDKRASLPEQKMTWLQGFISGFKIAIVVAILSPLVQLLTHHVISPDFFQNMREYSIASEMMSEARAEKYFNLNAYMFQAVAGAIGMGAITSAVVAFFLRRK